MSKRREFSRKLRVVIIARATNECGQITCENCGLILDGKPFEIDHIIPEGMIPDWRKNEKLKDTDGQLLGMKCCHRGPDGKTIKDVRGIRKSNRKRDKNSGAIQPKGKIKSPCFAGRKQPTMVKTPMKPRPLFERVM